jgi:thioredoxin reductase (NADPH)
MSQSGSQRVDALIVGGGPAGLTCAIYLARYRRNVIVVDSMESRAALIPETHNYPVLPMELPARSCLTRLRRRPGITVCRSFATG